MTPNAPEPPDNQPQQTPGTTSAMERVTGRSSEMVQRLDAASAYRVARAARAGSHILGWKLDRTERASLLARFPPAYADADADHVTLTAKVGSSAPLPSETAGVIVGRVDDGKGVEAMVVTIAGTTDRPDGSTYHITWSLDRSRGRKPVESNDAIRKLGWEPFADRVLVRLQPALWSRR